MLPTHREQTSQDRPSRAPAVLPAGRERLLPAAWAPDIAQPRLGPSAGPWPPESPPCQPEGNAHPPSCRHMPYAHGRRTSCRSGFRMRGGGQCRPWTIRPRFPPCRSEERRVGKECSVRVELGGRRIIKKKKNKI